jgi:gas vesicle protein
MSNLDKDSKLFMGIVIGGVVGIGALTIFLATRRGKESPLNSIGEAIVHIGEIFEKHDIEEPAPMRKIEKKILKHENTISEVLDWVATGIDLWKKIKD